MASATRETIKQTVQAQLDGYNNLSINEIIATRSADCVYEFLPKTLGIPSMNNDAYKQYFQTTIEAALKNFKFTADSFVYDVERRKAVVYGITTADTPFGPFVNECCILYDLDESGKKIVRVREMVDSAATAAAMAKLNELQASSAGRTTEPST